MNPRKLIRMIRAYRSGVALGDVVLLKLDALSAPPRRTLERLERVRGYAPEHELTSLRALPAGTLGREYARFLDANGIEPLVISAEMKARYHDAPYPLRFTTTHDLHHVLTGFDAGLAGELGVAAFYVGQGSAPLGAAQLQFVRALYSLLSPTQARTIWHNVRVGLELGRRAELVIAQPLESWFAEPLAEVRARLRIPEPASARVWPSGRSVFGEWIYPIKKKPA